MGDGSGQAADTRFGGATEGVMPESRVARVHLLRHAEVAGLERRVVRGQLEVGPGPRADRQEQSLVGWIASNEPRIDRVVSSDLERCQRLGRRLAERLGVELEVTEALREQSMGRWEGQTWEDVTAQEPDLVRAYWDDYAHTRPPGGEALTDLSERVTQWWRAEREGLLDRHTAIVTHVGVVRVLMARLLGLPLDQALRLAPAVASHTKLLWSEAGPVLEVFGERPWLTSDDQ